jgi:hypothetical protein
MDKVLPIKGKKVYYTLLHHLKNKNDSNYMNIEQTFIKDLVILTPKNIEDERGCF